MLLLSLSCVKDEQAAGEITAQNSQRHSAIIGHAMLFLKQGVDSDQAIASALERGAPAAESEVESAVREIISDVRQRGDQALLDLGRRFDCPVLSRISVPASEIEQAASRVDRPVTQALQHAAENIRAFHTEEKQSSWVMTRGPALLGQLVRPLGSVGLYVPGGRACYPSSVLMTAIPASVAGVERICLATPPAGTGQPPDIVLAACHLCGISDVFSVGGAQAIAAFAYGTASVPRVDKIAGPGNQYVNVAKRLVFGQVGIDSLAGPSEVMIVADGSAPAEWAAADLIAQAEHAGDSRAILLALSRPVGEAVVEAVRRQLAREPRRDLIEQSLSGYGAVIVASGRQGALDLINTCAPEHLQMLVEDPQTWLDGIKSAGAVFVGPYTPVPLGDYVAGPSHTLPTGTAARFMSGLGVSEFQKRTSLLWYGREGYEPDARAAMVVAEAESLSAHRRSLEVRLDGGSAS